MVWTLRGQKLLLLEFGWVTWILSVVNVSWTQATKQLAPLSKGRCEGLLCRPTQAHLGARSCHFLFLKTSHQAASSSSSVPDTRLCLHWAISVWIIKIVHSSPACLLVPGLVGLQSQEELGICGDFSFLPVEIMKALGESCFNLSLAP